MPGSARWLHEQFLHGLMTRSFRLQPHFQGHPRLLQSAVAWMEELPGHQHAKYLK